MATARTISDLEISQTADELVIRGRRMAVVVSTIAAYLLVPVSLRIAYKGVFGSSDNPAIWDQPSGDRLGVALIVLVDILFWTVAPILMCLMYRRKRRRALVFDRRRGELTRPDRSWPLAGLTAVVVDVRGGRKGLRHESAGVVLQFGEGDTLEIARFYAGGGKASVSLESRIAVAIDLAAIVGEFLQLPVRHPPPANQGFDVVLPARP